MTSPIQLPGSFGIPSVAPVYVDGIPAALVTAQAAKTDGQRFWSSQPRPAGDPAFEELTVSLGQERLINYVALDVPHFPHVMTFYWWDGSAWQPLRGTAGAPLSIITTGSVPGLVDSPAALGARVNPYHYGSGHWVTHDEQVQPALTSRLLLRSRRLAPAPWQQFPAGPSRRLVPYPLGARNIDFGLRVLSRDDVPPTMRHPDVISLRQPFTSSSDINGNPVQVSLRESRACDMLRGATWRCSPQPCASSVVSLYVDSRDGDGSPQVIDRFWLDPVTSGVRLSLYYSPVPPGPPFDAIDDPVSPSLIAPGGTQLPAAGMQGISFSQSPGWLDLSGQAAGADPASPWWAGIEVMPAFSSSDSGTYAVIDTDLISLSYAAGTWTATLPGGGLLGEWDLTFSPGDRVRFVAGHDGEQVFAWSPGGPMFHSPLSQPVTPAASFRFGGLRGSTSVAGNHVLTAFILKQERADLSDGVPADFTSFAAGTAAYVTPAPGASQATTKNASVRFSPALILGTVSPWGFAGGLGAAYESCPWVPVRGSLALTRGYVELDPVAAAAWKLEFTSLQPEPFEWLRPVPVTGRWHPLQFQPEAPGGSSAPAVIDPGLTVTGDSGPAITFGDAAPRSPAIPHGTILPTEALYAADPSIAPGLASRGGSLYNFQPWQPPHLVPLPPVAGPGAYREVPYLVIGRVAYFVALSGLAMYRVDYTAADDTEQYTETFQDAVNVDPSSLGEGSLSFRAGSGLTSPGNTGPSGAAAQSVTLASGHAVTGLQFATVQSDPVELLPDPGFDDPSFAGWAPVGDALPLAPSPQEAQLGTMVRVTRPPATPAGPQQVPTWAIVESTYASWSVLAAAVSGWSGFGQSASAGAMGGIAYAGQPVPATGAGRLYVAARVISPAALSASLWAQLLDGQTGAVIAEAEQQVAGGAVTEWFAGFTLGEGAASTVTWLALEDAYATWGAMASAQLTWAGADTSVIPLGTTVTARLIQKESTGDTWDVDDISIFEDSIKWEFSNDDGVTWYPAYDVRNNPHGALSFPVPGPGEGTKLRWRVTAYRPGLTVSSLAIRPWYVTWPRGIPPRPAGIGHGPNVAPQDQYGPVEADPRWRMSSSPVPDSWFFATRQALGLTSPPADFPGPAIAAPDVVLGNALVWQPSALAPAEPGTWTDIYSDTYTVTYAPADAGDLYTDTYADQYGDDYPSTTGTVRQGAAALTGDAVLTAPATTTPMPAWGLGSDLGAVPASDPSVAALIAATGGPLPARRVPLGSVIPASLAASDVAGDAGVRRVLLDVRPDALTTPAQLDAFLADCQAGGLQASVSVWAGADAAFGNPADWLALLPDYVAVIRRNGYQHVLTIDNRSVASGWLSAWYPGDGLVDVIAPSFRCTGLAPGSGGDTLAAAAAFADAHGKPLGLAVTGVDHARYTVAQGEAFTRYLESLFSARKAAGRPGYDLYWDGTGSYSVVTAPAGLLAAYQALAAAL